MWKFNRSLVLLKHFRNCLYRLQFVQLQLIAASEAFVVPAAAIPLVDQLVEISFTPFPVEQSRIYTLCVGSVHLSLCVSPFPPTKRLLSPTLADLTLSPVCRCRGLILSILLEDPKLAGLIAIAVAAAILLFIHCTLTLIALFSALMPPRLHH